MTTPDDAATQIAEYPGTPVQTVFVWASPGALPEDLAMRHVRTLGVRLAPLVKSR